MKYTKHFGSITREHGTLNLSSRQFQRMMNTVHLEGVILGLNKVKDTLFFSWFFAFIQNVNIIYSEIAFLNLKQ